MREEAEAMFRTLGAGKMSIALGRDEREQGYSRELYSWRTPREYHPSFNAPAVQSVEYSADTDWESHDIPHSDNSRVFPAFADTEPEEQSISYEQSKTMSEFFLKAMEVQYHPFEDGQEVPSLADIWHEHLVETAGLNHEQSTELSDMTDSAKEVESTTDIRSMHSIPDLEGLTGALVQLREVFAEHHPDIARLSTAVRVLGAIPESARHAAGMITDEINQAIDQVTERVAQEREPDPSQMQYDPYRMAQSTFDQQMQYMANPLMMPGTMLPPVPWL